MFWLTLKKYWKIAALIVGGIIGFIFLRREATSFIDDYKKIQDAHDKEIADIQKARDEERAQLEANQKKLEATLAEIQKKYDEQQKQLDDKKKAEIAQIVKDHGNDPNELAKQLQDATGFKVILPEG